MKPWIILFISAVLAASAGCKKFVAVEVPADRVIADRVFTTDAKATSAVTAIYGNMVNGGASFGNSLTTVAGSLSSDELLRFNPPAADAELVAGNISTGNATASAIWKSAYQVIYQTTAVLEGLSASTTISPSVRNGLVGECKFLRSFCYFYLVNFFGDVPLVTATDYRVNAALPRSSGIYAFIIQELKEAKENLPEAYTGTEKVRPNKWTAAALLARVYLYTKDWAAAEAEATAIINSSLYTPLPALSGAFLKNSKEAIWQLAPLTGLLRETANFRAVGSPLAPQYYFQPAFVNAFEGADNRRTKWFDSVTYLSAKYYLPGKYKNTTATVTEYYTVFRVAEIILLRAEARAQQNNPAGAVADINVVRARAGLASLTTTLSGPQVQAAIEQERRVELFAEWGHRWFDLVRWGKATAVLSPLKPLWQPTAVLYPVPADEIIANPSLTQNPGY